VTDETRILCAVCAELTLCLECFSAAVELRAHKYWHDYYTIESLVFPFLADWTAQEEQLLLEGLESFGVNNWSAVAEYVGTRGGDGCRVHYEEFYMNSTDWPISNFDKVLDPRLLHGKQFKRSKAPSLARKERRALVKQSKRVIPCYPTRSDLSEYMPKREEFECEWDDSCEQRIIDIVFESDDSEDTVECKMQLLEIYNLRLSKRNAMKKFAVEKKLHDLNFQTERRKSRSHSEQEIHQEMKKYIQLMELNEYEDMIHGLARQKELEILVKELQQFRALGLTSLQQVQPQQPQQQQPQQSKSNTTTTPIPSSKRKISRASPPSPLPGDLTVLNSTQCPPRVSVTPPCSVSPVTPAIKTQSASIPINIPQRKKIEEYAPPSPATRCRTKKHKKESSGSMFGSGTSPSLVHAKPKRFRGITYSESVVDTNLAVTVV